MRAGVLIRSWLSALFGFFAVTMAFCVALVVAITGPPNWAELRGVGDSVGAAFGQVSAFAARQIEAYSDTDTPADAPAPVVVEAPPPAPPRVFAEAPVIEEGAPNAGADDLAGGLDDPEPSLRAPPSPRVAPPVIARAAPSVPIPRAAASQPPRTLAPRAIPAAPAQAVEIAPPVAPAVERPSLTEQLMQAVEALIPSVEVSEEAPKTLVKEPEPLADPYVDEPVDEGLPPAHAETRQARRWTSQPGDRFPVDARDLERWGRQ